MDISDVMQKFYWWDMGEVFCSKALMEYCWSKKPCQNVSKPPSYLLNLPGEVMVVKLLMTILVTPLRIPEDYESITHKYSRSLLTLECLLVAMPWLKRFVLFITDYDDPGWERRISQRSLYRRGWSDMVSLPGVEHISLYDPSMSSNGATLPGTFCMTGSTSAPRLNVMYLWNSEAVAGSWKLTGSSSRSLYRKYLHLPQTVVFILPWCKGLKSLNVSSTTFGYEMVSRLASEASVPVIEHEFLSQEHLPEQFLNKLFNIWFGTENYHEWKIKDVNKIASYIKSSYSGRQGHIYTLNEQEHCLNSHSEYQSAFKIRLPSPCITRSIVFPDDESEDERPIIPAAAQGCPAYFIQVPLANAEKVYIEFDTSRIPWLTANIEARNFTMYEDTLLSLLNTHWNFQVPHGITCEHAHLSNGDMTDNDQAHWLFYTELPPHSNRTDHSIANSPFHSVVYVGIPDMMLTRLTGWGNARFLYWKRLVPRLNSATFQPNIFPDGVESIECPMLKKIKLFDQIHSEEVINTRPKFTAPALEDLIVVCLEGSNKVPAIDDVLCRPGGHTRLKSLHIVSAADSSCENYPLKLEWSSLLSSLVEYVHRLVVSGIIPSFVNDVSSSLDAPKTSNFYQLRSIAIDLLPFCQDLFKSRVSVPLDFSNPERFPVLKRVYLMFITERIQGGIQLVHDKLKNIEVRFPETVKVFDVDGSLIEHSRHSLCIFVNGKEISLPSQCDRMVRYHNDIFFRWKKRRTGGHGDYQWKLGSVVRHDQSFWDWIDEQR